MVSFLLLLLLFSIVIVNAIVCRVHYKEYLVTEINKVRIDPVTIMTVAEIARVVQRVGIQCNQRPGEDDATYKGRLLKVGAQLEKLRVVWGWMVTTDLSPW